MLLPISIAILTAGPTADSVFDQILAAHAKLNSGTVRIQRGQIVTYLKFQKPGLLAVRTIPPVKDLFQGDRIAISDGASVRVYEPFNNELYSTQINGVKSIEGRFGLTGTTKDEVVQMIVSPTKLAEFFHTIREYQGWKHVGNTLKAVGKSHSGGYTAVVGFDSTYRLANVSIEEGKTQYRFSLDWSTKSADFSIPTSTRRVTAFSGAPSFPMGDPKAIERIVQMYRAYTRFVAGSIKAVNPTETYSINFGNGFVGQSGAKVDWKWNGTSLVWSVRGSASKTTVKATDSSIRKEVAKLADRPHPITLSLLKHGLPISAYLGQQRVATFDGSASIGSVPCEVVKLIDRSNLILKLYIRRSDHLLEAVDSETVDDRGVKVSSQRTKFSYTR